MYPTHVSLNTIHSSAITLSPPTIPQSSRCPKTTRRNIGVVAHRTTTHVRGNSRFNSKQLSTVATGSKRTVGLGGRGLKPLIVDWKQIDQLGDTYFSLLFFSSLHDDHGGSLNGRADFFPRRIYRSRIIRGRPIAGIFCQRLDGDSGRGGR